jgi:hypothetical protein
MRQGRAQLPLEEQSLEEMLELERSTVSGESVGRTGDTTASDCSRREVDGASDERGGSWHAGQMSAAVSASQFGRVAKGWIEESATINQIGYGVEICSTEDQAETSYLTGFSATMNERSVRAPPNVGRNAEVAPRPR